MRPDCTPPAQSQTPAANDRRYLKRIGNRWYARIPVPNRLRPKLGPFVQRALGTADLGEAKRRRWDVMEEARALFARHSQGTAADPTVAHGQSYEAWRQQLKTFGPAAETRHGDTVTPPEIDRLMDRLTAEQAGEDDPRVLAVRHHIEGLPVVTETLADYLEHNPKRNPTTETNYRATVRQWTEINEDRPLAGTTRRQALEWLDQVGEGKARDTVKRHVTVV